MLDKKDLSAIKEMIDESLDARFAANNVELEKRLDAKLDERLHESENAILEEMDRVRGILEEKIKKVDDKVEKLDAYVSVAKIDGDNARLALEKFIDHERRIQKLESQIA